MKYVLSSYGLNNPFIQTDLPEHAVFPLTLETPTGLDLDYTSLLIGQGYALDRAAYDYICSGDLGFLAPMARTLDRLREAGLLTLIDVDSIVAAHKDELRQKTILLSEDVQGWLPLVRQQWHELKADRPQFQAQYGSPSKAFENENHATVLNALNVAGLQRTQSEVDRLTALVEKPRKRFNNQEIEELRLIIRPLIAHILIYDLVRSKCGGIVLDWDDSHRYYEKLYLARWDAPVEEDNIVKQARQLLNLTMPSLRADNVESVIKFVSDNRAVESLRSQVISCIRAGEKIDARWWNEYLVEVIKSRLHREGVMKRVRFGTSILGLFVPGASLLTEAAEEGVSHVIEESVEHGLSKRQHYWFYALQKATETRS